MSLYFITFSENPDFNQSLGNVLSLESYQGRPFSVIHFFTNWCQALNPVTQAFHNTIVFGEKLPSIWSHPAVPLISFQPACFEPNLNSAPSFLKEVVEGKYDAFLDSWSGMLGVWLSGVDGIPGTGDDRRVYIRMGHEMNTNFYPCEYYPRHIERKGTDANLASLPFVCFVI
jgi:hypothetical protein